MSDDIFGNDGLDDIFGGIDEKIPPPDWVENKKFVLVTPANIDEIIDICIKARVIALDLECSGLDNRVYNGSTVDLISGVGISPDGVTAYYAPLRHVRRRRDGKREALPCNIPHNVFDKAFRRLIAAIDAGEVIVVFHNGKFDQEFLQYPGVGIPSYGEWDKQTTWEDTLILAYLKNSRARDKRLETLSRDLLGIQQLKLRSLFSGDHKGKLDFSILDPNRMDVQWYVGGDVICTRLLFDILHPEVIEPADGHPQGTIYKIEKLAVAATRWMERNRIFVNPDKILELIILGQKEWFDSIMEVYANAKELLGRDVMPGYLKFIKERFVPNDPTFLLPAQLEHAKSASQSLYVDPKAKVKKGDKEWTPVYDVGAPQQLGTMFDEMGVPGLVRTEKSGQIKTSKDILDRVIESTGADFPFMAKVKRFREVVKALSTYLMPMYLDRDPRDNSIRINFQGHKVDTGRYATPSGGKGRERMIGWPKLNLQATPATYDPDRPECMRRIRECIIASPNSFLVAVDFAGQELRVVSNLSLEPKWVPEFFHCSGCDRTFDMGDGQSTPKPPPPFCPNCGSDKIGDLHTLTALEIFGADARDKADWKERRQDGKRTNFALCYGGGGFAVQRATGCGKQEGWRIKRQFDRTYPGLRAWWGTQHEFGKANGFVLTAFGRKYPVPDITHEDGGFRSKAERNAVNGPIQGTGADICKIAMALVYKECKKRGWLDKVRMNITMHDELVFDMDLDILEEALLVLVPIMCRNKLILSKRWAIPMMCDVEFGPDWTVKWDLNKLMYKNGFPDELKTVFPVLSNLGYPIHISYPFDEQVKDHDGDDGGGNGASSPPTTEGGDNTSPPPVAMTPADFKADKQLPPGEAFKFRLSYPLTPGLAERLANVIVQSAKRGTHTLQLEAVDGTNLDAWVQWGNDGKPLHINAQTFSVLAERDNL